VLKPIATAAMERQPDWMARLGGENLTKSMTQAIQHAETSHLDSHHPLPALAHGQAYAIHAGRRP
jgi:hypothetical protein